jgi:hypothetical protein
MIKQNPEDIIQTYFFFILWNIMSSNKSGECSFIEKKYNINLSLILPITDNKNIHLHHWIYLIIVLKKYRKNTKMKNFCIAGIISGLLYKDSLKIIKKNTKKTKLFLSSIKNNKK